MISRPLPPPPTPRRWLLAILLALTLLALAAPLAQADDNPPRAYVVAAGDTLSGIAQRFGVSLDALMAANDLSDPNLIFVGQRLVIPGAAVARPAVQGTAAYQMRPGESATELARRYRLTPQSLLALNGLNRPQYLLLEPEILVPAAPANALPAPFVAVAYTPEIVQGQTGVVRVTLAEATPPDARLGKTALHMVFKDKTPAGYRYEALIPTGALAKPGDRKLALSADGQEITRPLHIGAGDYDTQHIVLPPSKSDLLEPQKVASELEKLSGVWETFEPRRWWRDAFRFPIDPGFQRTSPYGTRRSYNDGPVNSYHAGSDWSAPQGTPIRAPARGVIALAENLTVRGGAVIIDHGQGVYSNFWHLSQILVEPGQRVERGDVIGLVGTTGLSTGAHLHWEVRVNGVAVDPLQWTEVQFPYLPLAQNEGRP